MLATCETTISPFSRRAKKEEEGKEKRTARKGVCGGARLRFAVHDPVRK